MEPYLGKHYKLDTVENLEEYLKYIEVTYVYRKFMRTARPVACLERMVDGSYVFELNLTVQNFTKTRLTFKLGEKFVEVTGDNVKVITTAEIEENRLYLTQVELNGRKSTHVCKFTPELMKMTTTAEGWEGKAVRKFNRSIRFD